MSRIILSKYDDGTDRFVVGWDHPANGCFWQEFNKEPEPDPVTGLVDWGKHEDWEEVIRYGGMWPGISLSEFKDSVPEDLRPMITEKVVKLLAESLCDPESGRWEPLDLSETPSDAHRDAVSPSDTPPLPDPLPDPGRA